MAVALTAAAAPATAAGTARTMAAMKLAVLRHSMNGQKAGLIAVGGTLGLVLAGGTLFAAFQSGDLLAAAYAVWMLGWILGPVFSGEATRRCAPSTSPSSASPRRLAGGLLVGAFVGVAPAISLLALAGLAVSGVRQSPAAVLAALPAMLLQLAIFVLLSRVAVAALGIALRSRAGAIGTGLVNGAILAALGQGWVFVVALGQAGGITPRRRRSCATCRPGGDWPRSRRWAPETGRTRAWRWARWRCSWRCCWPSGPPCSPGARARPGRPPAAGAP
nr:hypothetical protein GCM10020093_096840 [Planobispora longispora]